MSQPTGEQQQPAPAPAPPATPPPAPTPGPPPATPPPAAPRTFTQEEFNAFEAKTKREYRAKAEADAALIEKGKKLEALLGEGKSPEEQLQEMNASQAQKDQTIKDLNTALLRNKLAATANLHPTLWDRVRGDTEAEILADIETLKPAVGTPGVTTPPPPGGPQPNPQQGNPSAVDGKTGSVADGRSLYEQRNGKKQDAAQ